MPDTDESLPRIGLVGDPHTILLGRRHRRSLLPGPGAGLAEGGEETRAIGLVVEDIFAPVAAIDEVIERAGKFNASFARHGRGGKQVEALASSCLCTMQALTPTCRRPADSPLGAISPNGNGPKGSGNRSLARVS